MRFAVAPSGEDDISPQSYSDAEAGPSRYRQQPLSKLGKNIRALVDSSDEEDGRLGAESSSDDDMDDVGLGASRSRTRPWKMLKKKVGTTPQPPKQTRTRKNQLDTLLHIVDEAPTGYDAWLKVTQQAEWRDGHKLAHSRRVELREIALNARDALKLEQEAASNKGAEDMRKMLEGMSLQVSREEEEARRVFKEREKKLWEDIDAAIKRAEDLSKEKHARESALRQRREDEAKAAEEERQRAEAQAKRDAELADARAKQEAEQRQEAEAATRRAQAERGQTGAEWRKCVDKQKWMRRNVIEPVKGDRQIRMGLRQGMRLVTRGLGQVVNTKESIIRVTNDINDILQSQLSAPPSPAAPVVLDTTADFAAGTQGTPPRTYLYLLSHVSKGLIKQAETEVSAKADAAFPLSRIVVGLMLRGHAALGDIFFARLVKKCPWVVPFYPARGQNQSREEYEKSTGRGTDETSTDYINRMSGILLLYFSILQSPLSSFLPTLPSTPTPLQLVVLIPEPFRLPAAWAWLAHILRSPINALQPVSTLLVAWINVCGYEVGRVYGRENLERVYKAIEREGVEREGLGADTKAARGTLGLVLADARGKGEPKGRMWE